VGELIFSKFTGQTEQQQRHTTLLPLTPMTQPPLPQEFLSAAFTESRAEQSHGVRHNQRSLHSPAMQPKPDAELAR
jgi:hypothetical protein